ncbi:uncharacterized protein LOC125844328 [Solanum stenotomum]|uniref:uncharacterized protein LOC125844328 n=1 Tax=Solanum stenotomum TaxID=172797 RepID=UPI0020D06C00|nr:uncharacterized protein LOC125844328 [Solanum stenotomum]XP_049379578.1 uncharacterized protein LOC125844328 [Solanum stenotomum]XP_049379579.1 uncharacterized protein LOC125844328 [Solanum stenotomum]
MTSSGKEDQDQSKIDGIEDSKTTIEFLRGRLLAERSASRTAKQRADELAQRVSELEEQLKVVSLQRKKAEKATAAVLSILEDHAIDDVSEEFSSGSDKETILSDQKDAENKTGGDISSSAKEKEDDVDTLSSSGTVSSSSTARSLSWKSGKSAHSLDRRKYTDSNRRRYSNFSSTDISSPKRVGNSCRRIRRRDTRSASDKLQNSSAECAPQALPSSANNEPQSLTAGAGNSDVNDQVHVSALDVSGNGREADKSDEDSKRALHQQAQLIGQYEAEEKAQREWEEKYRESNSGTLDSCDRENYSDVTEERDDLKASQEPCLAGSTSMQNHANQSGAADVSRTEQNGNIDNSPSTPHVDMSCLEDKKGSRTVESDSPASELARPMSNGNYLENHGQTSAYTHQQSLPVTRSPMHPRSSSLQAGQALQTGYELALVSHNTSNSVNSVLGELEQAKLSLTKQINSSLPTASYPGMPSRFSSVNQSPEPSTYETSLSPYMESRSKYVTQGNRVTYPFQRAFPEVSSSAPSYRPISETNFDAGQPSSMRFNPNSSSHLPLSSKFTYPSYPKFPDMVPKLPPNEVFSRNYPTNETDLPPSFSFSTWSPKVVPRLPSTEKISRNFPTNETDPPPSFSFSTLSPEVVPRLPSTGVFPRNIPTNETGIPPSFASRNDPHIRPNMYRG